MRTPTLAQFTVPFAARMNRVALLTADERIAALGESLAVCSPRESAQISAALLAAAKEQHRPSLLTSLAKRWTGPMHQRRRLTAMAYLARHWNRLPEEIQTLAAAEDPSLWAGAVDALATDPNPSQRSAVAALAGRIGDPILSPVIGLLICDPEPRVAVEAETALANLSLKVALAIGAVPPDGVDNAVQKTRREDTTPQGADILAAVVAHACSDFENHRKRGALLAALLLAGGESCRSRAGEGWRLLADWLESGPSVGHSALQSVLRFGRLPVARVRAMEWLTNPVLAGAAAERLSRCEGLIEHELVLRRWHLGLRPARAVRLAEIRVRGRTAGQPLMTARAAVPSAGVIPALGPHARRGVPGLVCLVRTDAISKRAMLSALLADEDSVTRHAAMRAASPSTMIDWCFDPAEDVARGAMLRRAPESGRNELRATPAVGRIAQPLLRSPHPIVRAWAQWESGEGRNASGMLTVRRAARSSPQRVEQTLRAGLSGASAAVGETLRVVRALGWMDRFADEICAIASSPAAPHDARLVATAVAMAAKLQTQRAAAALTTGLKHPDARVRANAVEAAVKRAASLSDGPPLPSILELKHDPNHRVRANAVLAGIRSAVFGRKSCDELLSMLAAPEQPMRLAALWAAGRAGQTLQQFSGGEEIIRQVGLMAATSQDPRVRARAAAAALGLEISPAPALRLVGHMPESESLKEVA
ncbi:MAG: hypothetical protein JSR77_18360 [Planctomycetes bacterium]|nr:hypothetical protein [Planctomycetota bacterium]